MSFNPTQFPFSAVVQITDKIDGQGFQASGVLVAPNEVLTAAHVVWDSGLDATATNITVVPALNGGAEPFGSASAENFHYFPIDDTGGLISTGQTQSDFALIHISSSITAAGTMGIQPNFSGGAVDITGYPGDLGGDIMDDTSTSVSLVPGFSVLEAPANSASPGDSGGPWWTMQNGQPFVVGITSTGSSQGDFAGQISISIFNQIESWTQLDNAGVTTSPTLNSPPSSNATAEMVLFTNTGSFQIFDIGNNAMLGSHLLGQVSSGLAFAGLGNFSSSEPTDMMLRNASTGDFQVVDISNDNITSVTDAGAVGLDWQLAGFGTFVGGTATGMMLRNSGSGIFEVYDIASNRITSASAMGAVGLEWQVAGFGDFSGNADESDMMLRNSSTGMFELYDVARNQLLSASAIGAVGLEWKIAGFGDFSGNANESDMMLRNSNTGEFEVYDITHNSLASASAIGAVGLDWQVAGFGPFNGAGTSDMVLRSSTTGQYEIYDIAHSQFTTATLLGTPGASFQVGGFAPTSFASSQAAAQLTQAMAGFGAAAGSSASPATQDLTIPEAGGPNLLQPVSGGY